MKIVTIVGARPQFIKAAPVSRAIEKHNLEVGSPRIDEVLLHTGQHYDSNMSQIFFDELQIRKPDYNLEVGSGRHGQMTGEMLARIESVLLKEKPAWVLVYGDTNSTLAGALGAAKLQIAVAHVEAGLRSFNRRMPEEINRVLVDHISTLLFCPTQKAVENLQAESIVNSDDASAKPHSSSKDNLISSNDSLEDSASKPLSLRHKVPRKVLLVGDVMHDAFLFNKELAINKSEVVAGLGLRPGSYYLATVHREENTDDLARLSSIFFAFNKLANAESPVIIPVHPRIKKSLERQEIGLLTNPSVKLIPPVSYLDMIALEVHARTILTDSGGMQKEAYFAGVPCVTLRDETEWVETIEAGWNVLAGCNWEKIVSFTNEARVSNKQLDYGDGCTAERIVQVMCSLM